MFIVIHHSKLAYVIADMTGGFRALGRFQFRIEKN